LGKNPPTRQGTPANRDEFAGRLHRIGRKQNSLQCGHGTKSLRSLRACRNSTGNPVQENLPEFWKNLFRINFLE